MPNINSRRRQWSEFSLIKDRNSLRISVFHQIMTKLKAKTSSCKHVFFPCRVEKNEGENGENTIYRSTGGVIISGKQYITIKLPYGLSANEIWRATIDQNGKQRNSLSVGAKNIKTRFKSNMDLCLGHLS